MIAASWRCNAAVPRFRVVIAFDAEAPSEDINGRTGRSHDTSHSSPSCLPAELEKFHASS
jgi:hypothetical protein